MLSRLYPKSSPPKKVPKTVPKPLPLPQQKLGVVPRARKQSERDRFNKHRKNDKNVTWSPHRHQTDVENNENYAKVEKLFSNINYESSSKTSHIFDSSFSINSIIPDLNPIAEILQPDNFTNQNITGIFCKNVKFTTKNIIFSTKNLSTKKNLKLKKKSKKKN